MFTAGTVRAEMSRSARVKEVFDNACGSVQAQHVWRRRQRGAPAAREQPAWQQRRHEEVRAVVRSHTEAADGRPLWIPMVVAAPSPSAACIAQSGDAVLLMCHETLEATQLLTEQQWRDVAQFSDGL